MSKGLYFYKLVSPYKEDVTKDCKLTINEIDSNFITLKDADIKEFRFDEETQHIILTRNDGEELVSDISSMIDGVVRNLRVDYNKEEGEIVINYNGERVIISDIITKENLSKKVLTEVATDNTLVGFGTYGKPLGLKNVEKTGQVGACKKFIDTTAGELLPNHKHAIVGDRYLTLEKISEYGYLYDYKAVKLINSDVKGGWRVPTKEDWDNILNAIEPCEKYRNHNSLTCNKELGRIAGKLLKSRNGWLEPIFDISNDDEHKHHNEHNKHDNFHNHKLADYMREDESFEEKQEEFNECDFERNEHHPKEKPIPPKGVDWFHVRILPAGYGDGCQLMDYFGKRGAYWSSTMIDNTDVYVKRFDYRHTGVIQTAESPRSVFSIRLVKDYDGSNYNEVEFINGQFYPCVLVPCLETAKGFIIVTSTNVAFDDHRYHPVKVGTDGTSIFKPKFFTIEWNGEYWDKKMMKEGDSVVLFKGIKEDEYNEYRLIGNRIVSTTDKLHDEISEEINKRIDKVQEQLDNEITRAIEKENELETKLDSEIQRAEETDKQLWEAVNNEIAAREEVERQLWEAVNNEIIAREDVEKQLWHAINEEISAREKVDQKIWDAINNESSSRLETERQLWEAVNNEIAAREEAERQLWENIKTIYSNLEQETKDRVSEDNRISSALEQETKDRVSVDNQQWERINYNTEHLIQKNGSSYDNLSGELTLMTENPENKITIEFNGNYGTF